MGKGWERGLGLVLLISEFGYGCGVRWGSLFLFFRRKVRQEWLYGFLMFMSGKERLLFGSKCLHSFRGNVLLSIRYVSFETCHQLDATRQQERYIIVQENEGKLMATWIERQVS